MATETADSSSLGLEDEQTQSIMPDGGAPVEGAPNPNATHENFETLPLIQPSMDSPEFKDRVEQVRSEVVNQIIDDHARREQRLEALTDFVQAVLESNATAPHDNFYTRSKDALAISTLSKRLKEINFTEAEAAWTARLLDGHFDWQLGTENGRWFISETKIKNPKRFSTTFRFASAAMKVMTYLNMGYSVTDPNVLAAVGASQRLEDLIKTLDEEVQGEINSLLAFMDKSAV